MEWDISGKLMDCLGVMVIYVYIDIEMKENCNLFYLVGKLFEGVLIY